MYTFGILGNYVSQGVYAVAGPLQGAVDIIVVKQEDGTFKSSPWYVKCGDSQGYKEEAKVEICVNGVKTDLYMLMNRKGETFFEHEQEDTRETEEDSDGSHIVGPEESICSQASVQFEAEAGVLLVGSTSVADADSEPNFLSSESLLAGDRLKETSAASELSASTSAAGADSETNFLLSESSLAADRLMETSVASELSSSVSSVDGFNETGADLEPGAILSVSSLGGRFNETSVDLEAGAILSVSSSGGGFNESIAFDTQKKSIFKSETVEESSQCQDFTCPQSDVSDLPSISSSSLLPSDETSAVDTEADTEKVAETSQAQVIIPLESLPSSLPLHESKEARAQDNRERNGDISETKELPQCPVIVNLDNSNLSTSSFLVLSPVETASSVVENEKAKQKGLHLSNVARDTNIQNSTCENIQVSISSEAVTASYTQLPDLIDICTTESIHDNVGNKSCKSTTQVAGAANTDLLEVPSIGPQVNFMAVGELVDTCGHLDGPNVVVAEDWFSIHKTEALQSGSSSIVSDAQLNGDTTSGFTMDSNAGEQIKREGHNITNNGAIQMEGAGSLTGIDKNTGNQVNNSSPPQSRWNMWPLSFRRSRSSRVSAPGTDSKNETLLTSTNAVSGNPSNSRQQLGQKGHKHTQKRKVRSYAPTSSQIESLQLKDGANKVTFTFPGRNQVDAYIYLWKWNARIVISDVDGTITKSDVLGQVMPLVGRDWSQYGVTRLFSAIKENGYEVLFLSARAISQAYLTRRFLGSLKQDGEALPEGPIFISPDGLLPSLYREVIRRTPHEFKIACLEEIRRLFPRDVNPFYAGFGNRHTDELSYRKVGIPKGKIFIINPKGEIMVNQHHHIKTYTSIHKLVDGMFPPVSRSEQEDFNSWNYWKLPLPNVGDDLSPSSSKGKKVSNKKK